MKTKEKLKTLKDLKEEFTAGDYDSGECLNIIKAEAVKWVKVRDELIKEGKKIEDINKLEFETIMAIAWIKHFFNLTEDLQEKKE